MDSKLLHKKYIEDNKDLSVVKSKVKVESFGLEVQKDIASAQ